MSAIDGYSDDVVGAAFREVFKGIVEESGCEPGLAAFTAGPIQFVPRSDFSVQERLRLEALDQALRYLIDREDGDLTEVLRCAAAFYNFLSPETAG